MRVTVPSALFVTQSEAAPAATADGSLPTSTSAPVGRPEPGRTARRNRRDPRSRYTADAASRSARSFRGGARSRWKPPCRDGTVVLRVYPGDLHLALSLTQTAPVKRTAPSGPR